MRLQRQLSKKGEIKDTNKWVVVPPLRIKELGWREEGKVNGNKLILMPRRGKEQFINRS